MNKELMNNLKKTELRLGQNTKYVDLKNKKNEILNFDNDTADDILFDVSKDPVVNRNKN